MPCFSRLSSMTSLGEQGMIREKAYQRRRCLLSSVEQKVR